MLDIAEPPAIYLPYTGPLVRIERELPRVGLACRALGVTLPAGRIVYGCAMWGAGGCLEIIARVPDPADHQAIVDHEDAHCNGWTHPAP